MAKADYLSLILGFFANVVISAGIDLTNILSVHKGHKTMDKTAANKIN